MRRLNISKTICAKKKEEDIDKGLPYVYSYGIEYKQASLAVQKANYAVRLYEKVGFKIVDENEEEYIMVREL